MILSWIYRHLISLLTSIPHLDVAEVVVDVRVGAEAQLRPQHQIVGGTWEIQEFRDNFSVLVFEHFVVLTFYKKNT